MAYRVSESLMTLLQGGPDDACRKARIIAEYAATMLTEENPVIDFHSGMHHSARVRRMNRRVYRVTYTKDTHDTVARVIEL
jgi:hypothetical protein